MYSFKNIRGLLKRDGIFFYSAPHADLYFKERDKDSTHVWVLNSNEWSKIIEKWL